MPFWYYFSVPRLPPEVAHQSNLVEIRNYLTAEGSPADVRPLPYRIAHDRQVCKFFLVKIF
jgi:hypothetical protein